MEDKQVTKIADIEIQQQDMQERMVQRIKMIVDLIKENGITEDLNS